MRASSFDRDFGRMRRIFWVIFGTACVFIVTIFVFNIFIAVKLFIAAEDIAEVGARGVIERIWCGKSADCSLSLPKDTR